MTFADLGLSQTGSGKTAAFALPAIERVDANLRAPQVLILCPTRELAMQVAENSRVWRRSGACMMISSMES
jgi:ATP-dependent RNA helicase DeaD